MKRDIYALLMSIIEIEKKELSNVVHVNSKSISIELYRCFFKKILPCLYELSVDIEMIKNDTQFHRTILNLIKYVFQVLTLSQLYENDFILKIFDFILNNLNSTLTCAEVSCVKFNENLFFL